MEQYVMMTGTLRMHLSSASNLDSRPMVRSFFTCRRLAVDSDYSRSYCSV